MTRSSFGSIRRLDNERIQVRWDEPTADGKRRQRSRTIRGDMSTARAFLASQKASQRLPGTFEPLPLRCFWLDYIESAELRLKPSTIRGYQRDWHYIVQGAFGGLDMRSATTREIERTLWTLPSYGAQRSAYKLLRQMFNKAHDWELIDRNPMARHIDLMRRRKSEPDRYAASEIPAVLDAWRGADWEAAAIMSLCAGLRREEALALTWEDFTWNPMYCTAFVHRAITDAPGGSAVVDTKTARSERTVTLAGYAFERLRELRGSGALVPGTCDGFDHPRNVVQRYKRWMHAKSRAHVRWVPWMHLRHTFATLAREAGLDAVQVAHALGHSDVSTAYRHYVGVDVALPIGAAQSLSALVKCDVNSLHNSSQDGILTHPLAAHSPAAPQVVQCDPVAPSDF